MNSLIKDGYERRAFNDSVLWFVPRYSGREHIYCVARFPFVPDYHVCGFAHYDYELPTEYPMQTFKTLAEALAVLRVLDASIEENQ